jgi:HEPN domain-containing protein
MSAHFLPIGRLIAQLMSLATSTECGLDELRKKNGSDTIITERTKETIFTCLQVADECANTVGMKLMKMSLDMFRHDLERPCTLGNAHARVREIRENMMRDLWEPVYVRASSDMIKYLDKSKLFGDAVSTAFANCIEDIAEAHQCFAFERYTASMFHIGRAMELAVKAVAKKMHITIKRDDWQSYLTAMNEKIAGMPFKTPQEKTKRAPFAETAAYLLHFKEAWRNPTMHPKKTYTRDEALEVLNGAGTFLRYVSREIFKIKDDPSRSSVRAVRRSIPWP